MNRKAKVCILSAVTVLILLTSCSTKKPEGTEQLTDKLRSQIDRDQDDYLSAVSDKSISQLLSLYSITYGSYTETGAPELLALFKVKDIPHAGGLDRTIAAIYDANSYNLISQKTFAADAVSTHLFKDTGERSYILFIGCTTYQGSSSYSIELCQAEKDIWITKAVSSEAFADNYAYALSSDALHVFKLSYNEHTPVYSYLYTLYWNIADAEFERGIS